MLVDSFSPDLDRAGEPGWLPVVHAAAAAALIGLVGAFGTLQVWVLALAGGVIAHSIARRDGTEPATVDHLATALKVAFVAVLCAAAYDNRTHQIDVLQPPAWVLAGFVLLAAGLELRRRAVAELGRHFSIKVVLRDDHSLVDSGPFRTIRHPNYAGLVLVMIGTAAVLESPLALAAVLSIWLPALLLRIRHEEHALERHLGDPYVRYAQRTWRLCPGLY